MRPGAIVLRLLVWVAFLPLAAAVSSAVITYKFSSARPPVAATSAASVAP